MSDAVIVALIAFAGSGGVAAIVTACLNRHWKKQDDKEKNVTQEQHQELVDKITALTTAQKTTMVERINYLGMCYIVAGEITLTDKRVVENMHKAYKDLGGNGDCDTIMEEIDKLPVVGSYHDKRKENVQ